MSNNAYHSFITDHLGSVRVVASASGVAEEYNHYYPLGGFLPTSTSITGIQPVKYQGKEWGAAKGLNLYDFGARRYDPATGRWLSQDPLAEKYYSISPYAFCHNNPIIRFDPNGMVDWKLFRSGVYTTLGGVASVVGGGLLAGASGGAVGGLSVFIISDGIVAIGTGLSLMTAGLIDEPQLSESIQDIPTNIPEMEGEIFDSLTENENHLYKRIGTGVDFGIGLGTSVLTKWDPLVPSIMSVVAPLAPIIDNYVSKEDAMNTPESTVVEEKERQKQSILWDPNQQLLSF